MNDPKLVELIKQVKEANACKMRIAPYEEKMAKGQLKFSSISLEDAVWILAVVKPTVGRKELKEIAKGHPCVDLL